MTKRLKLSKYRQGLVVEYHQLVTILSRYFLQNRPSWQRSVLIGDLEGEGYLALCKAARTYDKKKLPYPKAYFARAILNAMLKSIKRVTRTPGENKISLQEAAELSPDYDHLDHLRLAIEALPVEDQQMAMDRFMHGATLRTLSNVHDVPVRVASLSAARLQRQLAKSLDIRLQPREPGSKRPLGDSSRQRPSASGRASSRHRGPKRG